MAVATLLLGAGEILNTWYYTTALGGTPTDPVLINVDSYRWWHDALYRLGDSQGLEAHHSHGVYGGVLAIILFIFGKTVGTALLWSMCLILASLVMCGLITFRLTRNVNTAIIAMISCGAVCYWLTMGTLILKDAFLILAFLTGGYGFLCKRRTFILLTLLSIAMIIVSRRYFAVLIIVGLFMVRFRKINLFVVLACAVACLIGYYLYAEYHNPDIASDSLDVMSLTAPQQMAFYNVFGNYFELPIYLRILLLPINAGVQFLIPFVWTYARDIPFGITEVWAHIGFPWYIFGFVFIYYMISCAKEYNGTLYRLSFFALCCWLLMCIITGGTISRYGLPFVALMAPAVAVTLKKNYKKRRFYLIFGVYVIILSAVLFMSYHLQTNAMS